jgi:hypothetical protein
MTDLPYRDPEHPLNSSKYHTGKACVEKGCSNPAGTHWSHLWCVEHNAERLDRISKSLENELERLEKLHAAQKAASTD